MFIVHAKAMKKDGNNPTYLYGYGGFNISLSPTFSALRLCWLMNLGGIYAQPNLRGGGEYGKKWHEAGQKEKKQNVFDDFQAAAEYLIKEGYTSPKKLSIHGGSNGGLLVAACLNQRPDLFGCGVAAVGVLDMLKYHKFGIGHFWTSDYGSADNAEDFEYLYKYSPVHNVNSSVDYPAVMLTTGDHDDRVSPFHSYKYIATLQNALAFKPSQKAPLLIRIEQKAGHGAGKPTTKILNEYADVYSFVATNTGAVWSD
jgi:prolyl oligopeptidase